MCRPETTLNACTYIGQKGICGRPCFRDVCYLHTGRKSLPLCSGCGKRGTSSKTGYCQEVSTGCRSRAQQGARRLKNEADLDLYLATMIKRFYASSLDEASCSPPPSVDGGHLPTRAN